MYSPQVLVVRLVDELNVKLKKTYLQTIKLPQDVIFNHKFFLNKTEVLPSMKIMIYTGYFKTTKDCEAGVYSEEINLTLTDHAPVTQTCYLQTQNHFKVNI